MQMTMITPSYGPDFERCRLLVDSVNKHVPDTVEHVLLVDRRDAALFGRLAGSRTRVMTVESVLPWWIFRVPGARRWWFSAKSAPVRNWVLQQIVKLGVGEHIESENYMFVDSDVSFIRPMDPEAFADEEGNTVLYRNPSMGRTAMHAPWHLTASKMLGFYPCDFFGSNYIGNLITWRRDNLRLMYRHIEAVTGLPWMVAVARQWHLSEYILYGAFVEHVLGGRGHYFEKSNYCAVSWGRELETERDIDSFLERVEPEQIAVMVSSKQYVPPARYAEKLRRFDSCADGHPTR